MISGNASSCRDFTWMKWTSTPSISVLNCGSAFSRASHRRQSYSFTQYSRERPNRRQLHALRAILDELLSRPPHRCDAAAQVLQGFFREFNVERANRRGV